MKRSLSAACVNHASTRESPRLAQHCPACGVRLFFALCSAIGLAAGPEKRVVDGVEYHILRAPADAVRVLWKDADGKALRTLPAAAEYLQT